jgi:hypothetical protein
VASPSSSAVRRTSLLLFKVGDRELDLDSAEAVVRRVCEVLTVTLPGQMTKLKGAPWACITTIVTHDASGRKQEAFCIDLDSLPMWLATIDVGRVKSATAKRLLIEYQRKAARVLRNYFFGHHAANFDRQKFAVLVAGAVGEVMVQTVGPILDKLEGRRAEDHAADRKMTELILGRLLDIEEKLAAGQAAIAQGNVGSSGAREISRKLHEYGMLMAPIGDKAAIRSWRGSGETELRGKLSHFGAGRSWRALSSSKMQDARVALNEMLARARKNAGDRAQMTFEELLARQKAANGAARPASYKAPVDLN